MVAPRHMWLLHTWNVIRDTEEMNLFFFFFFKFSEAFPCGFYYFFEFLNFIYLFLYSRLSISYILVYICQSKSPNSSPCAPPPVSPLVSIRLFSTFVSLFLPCKPVHLYHFSRFHVYALIYDTCFSLSDLFHSVWQTLGPSTSLQMTQFHSFLWLSNIPLYICTTSSLSICLSVGI